MIRRSHSDLSRTGPVGVQPSHEPRSVSLHHCPWVFRGNSYHQLPHDSLVEVLRSHVDTLCYKIASVNMLLLHTTLPLLHTSYAFLLQSTSLSFLFRFSSMLERSHVTVMTAADAEQREVRATPSARPRGLVYRPSRGIGSTWRPLMTSTPRGRRSRLLGLGVAHGGDEDGRGRADVRSIRRKSDGEWGFPKGGPRGYKGKEIQDKAKGDIGEGDNIERGGVEEGKGSGGNQLIRSNWGSEIGERKRMGLN